MSHRKRGRDRALSARRQAGAGARLARASATPTRAPCILVAVTLVIVAIAGDRALAPSPPRAPSAALPDSIAAMNPVTAYVRALALAQAEREAESLPYFRRALTGTQANLWQLHTDHASALYNLTRRPRARHGLPIPTLRSTYEQVECTQRAWHELDVAESLARNPRDRAMVKLLRARMMQVWGLPWEAFVELRQARDLDPAQKDIAGFGDRYIDLMRAPHQAPRE